ncbi:MAG: hypothetical protein WDO18_06825 [Acidobacteriota bacterium]
MDEKLKAKVQALQLNTAGLLKLLGEKDKLPLLGDPEGHHDPPPNSAWLRRSWTPSTRQSPVCRRI